MGTAKTSVTVLTIKKRVNCCWTDRVESGICAVKSFGEFENLRRFQFHRHVRGVRVAARAAAFKGELTATE